MYWLGGIYDAFAEGKVGSFSWKKILKKKGNKLKVTKTNKSLLLFGMVAHTVADIFAHSVWEPFYIRGINGGVYTLNDMYKKVHYTIGGGDYYEE